MNSTQLNSDKLHTIASVVYFATSHQSATLDRIVTAQMIGEGIRKLHDCATSFRGSGKYLGHAHWSRTAIERLKKNGGTERGITNLLSHEHVVPVGVVLDKLLNNCQKSIADIEELIRCFSVVAIVTREEESLLSEAGLRGKMPNNWDGRDVWARYRTAGLYERIQSIPD
jgi:hypothetical protein